MNGGERTVKIKFRCISHQIKGVNCKMKIGKLEELLKVTCHKSIFHILI